MQKSIYSVGQVNRYIKGMFSQDVLLNSVYVRGEVSNLKYHTTGHIYFSLKDESGTLNCVMFRGDRKGLAYPMKDGDKVVVGGTVDVYERGGSYQLYAKDIKLEGAGLLYEQFLKLKQELEEMGMFSPLYKKPIPPYCCRIGVITAPTGAAVRDIQNIARRRNPYVQLILYPALVQGREAVPSLVKGLQVMDRAGVDVIIIGRGGGSLEDLWAFNEEAVARAIFDCGTPVISAVGHETDTTIADFVADLRAPTPSAAAELAVFSIHEFDTLIADRKHACRYAMVGKIDKMRRELRQYALHVNYLSPRNQLNEKRRRLADLENALRETMAHQVERCHEAADNMSETMTVAMHDKLRRRQNSFRVLVAAFRGLNPLDKLKQGFSYVQREDGGTLRRAADARIGDAVRIYVTDGRLKARIEDIKEQEYHDR